MTPSDNNSLYDEKTRKTLADNAESQKEIKRLLNAIEEVRQKKEAIFKELNISPEVQSQPFSEADFSVAEKQIYDVMQKEFNEGLQAKGIDVELKKVTKKKLFRKPRNII